MSKVLRNDNLKSKKQETKVLRSDTAATKNSLIKKSSSSSKPIKSSTKLHDIPADNEDKKKTRTKLINGTNSTSNISNKSNINPHKTQQQQAKTNASYKIQSNNLTPRKVSSSATLSKQQPLRAKPLTTSKVVKAPSKPIPSTSRTNSKQVVPTKPNPVLDTPHNVTVSSPPPKRKTNDQIEHKVSKNESKSSNSKLIRKDSRTLAPDEIVILKRESAKKRIEEKIQQENLKREQSSVSLVKEPVAFEINFDDKEKKTTRERSSSRGKSYEDIEKDTKAKSTTQVSTFEDNDRPVRENSRSRALNDEEHQYSDDFESYESDFETETSTHSITTTETSDSGSEDVSDEIENESDSSKQISSDESEDDSEVTQNPITVIHRDKERKLDSGHYELNSRQPNCPKISELSQQSSHTITDSLEAFSLGISDQLDSGISTYNSPVPSSVNKANIKTFYGGYKEFNTKPIVSQRGIDLMSKIQFDILSFTFLDLKPISYDIFMQTFGKLNTNQSYAQTQSNQMDVEQQTELLETRSIWTQHPAQYDLEIIKYLDKNGAIYNQNCCGEYVDESEVRLHNDCELEESLFSLKKLNNQSSQRNQQNYIKHLRKPVNYEHLNSFLLRSSLLLDQLLGSSSNSKSSLTLHSPYQSDPNLSKVSDHYFPIEANFLNTLHVVKIFANNKYNFLITVHESLPDTNVYSSDFAHLLMVWCINACQKPLRLLTTWSQVSKVEISNDSSDIIVAALRDGSIALWDLRETHSFCSKLDGYLTHFAATQSLVPSWNRIKNESKLMMDLGACLDVRSFRSQTNSLLVQTTTFAKTQFVSLHDSGIITVWTLVESSETSFNLMQTKNKSKYSSKPLQTFEYTSPWARVKLIQSAIVNIKDYLESKSQQVQSRFDKTKQLFQKDIYSDDALKELHEYAPDVGQQGLRFTSLECGSENLFICTNRNYILMCSKTLKMDKLKRIVINESRFLFPTALKVLSNENFLAVGLSNGAVMILNCQPNKVKQNVKDTSTYTATDSAPPTPDPYSDMNSITGKSCAIQNIVLNSQKSYEDIDFEHVYRPNTAACIALIESKQKPFELRIFDQQVIMSGSVLRKHLIQSLELSSNGWHLFALANGHIRIYDFYLDQELDCEESQESGEIIDIATAKCSNKENNLIILKPHKQVEVHILNK